MKYLVFFALIAVAAAAESEAEEQTRDKRGVLGLGAYPALPYAAPIALGYHAPIAKVIAPIPAIKVVQPAYVPYAKVAYPSYGLGYGYGGLSGLGYGHGLGYASHGLGYAGHGLGYGHGYGHGIGYGSYYH